MSESAPLGLFGGRFDPVHRAHLAIATAAADALHLTEIRWIVTGDPRYKAVYASGKHRFEMVRLALDEQRDPRMIADDREIRAAERRESNLTADTISGIQHDFPKRPLIWILGADQLESFRTWSRWQWLIDQVTLAVCTRPGSSADQSANDLIRDGADIKWFDCPADPISATQIRDRIHLHKTIEPLVPGSVRTYIDQNHLYQRIP
jgi:nicotinate-nucleotide adenylyltransferase